MTLPFLNHQSKAVNKLKKVMCGALFMEAGTGKTRAALEIIKSSDANYVLWFTPFQTKENLRKEIEKWGGLNCDIVGIESIQSSNRIYLECVNKCKQSKAFIIVDESLKIKNNNAKRTKRLLFLSDLSKYRMILNGTPLSRNLLDLYSQMKFLSPKILQMSMSEFKNTFCEYISVTHLKSNRSYTKEYIKQYHNIDHLYSLIRPFIFESRLSISIGIQHINLKFNLCEKEKKQHDFIKEKYLDDKALMAINNNIFLLLTQKLQHNYSLSLEKFDIVNKIIIGQDLSKILIYAKYIKTQKKLKEYYPNIRIMSLQKHSYGLNLQNYNTIIFWDKTWDFAQREQAERRIYRQGQKQECKYYDLTGNVGLENIMDICIKKKRKLLNIFKDKTIEEIKAAL